ncbi:cobalt ECF transporter T component CbiQ [Bacillus sp. T3]|uniref:cobalt ECF transporter T component CbiQ n=1 Tax=Bacillus sp. T3 TaxID=467262 RepID=UPI0029824C32|nr:cobalt ECF transporter T component CbiQ [Bacillus sp. T3]
MLLIDKYAYINRLKQVHPLEKTILSLSLLLFSLLVRDILVALITFIVMSSLIIFAAKIPVFYYAKLLILPGVFLLSSVFTILIHFTKGNVFPTDICWSSPIGDWQIFISEESFWTSVKLVVVVLSGISSLYFLTLTTPITDLLMVLRKLKLPILLIELIELTYRYVFIFIETALDIYQSQNARLGYSTIRRGIHSFGYLISVLFVSVFQRSKQLTMAMDARGYQEHIPSYENTYHLSPINWCIIIGIQVSVLFIYLNSWRLL